MLVLSKERVFFKDGLMFHVQASPDKVFIGFGGSITKTKLVASLYPIFLTKDLPWKPRKPAAGCCSCLWKFLSLDRKSKNKSKPLEMYKQIWHMGGRDQD